MKNRFIIVAKDGEDKFIIHYSYEEKGGERRVKRKSVYNDIQSAKNAAMNFVKKGYSVVKRIEDL